MRQTIYFLFEWDNVLKLVILWAFFVAGAFGLLHTLLSGLANIAALRSYRKIESVTVTDAAGIEAYVSHATRPIREQNS